MNELITLHGGSDEKFPVDGRELHAFLKVLTRFNDWIERRIKEYGFSINSDFCSFLSKSQGGRPSTEYRLTFSMAKELSMLENNKMGKQARRFFIQCEEKLKEVTLSLPNFNDPIEAARAWADAKEGEKLALTEKTQAIAYAGELELENAKAKPKVEYYDKVAHAPDTMSIAEGAKLMGIEGIGRDNLYKKLREWQIIMPGKREPYQRYINQGWFKMEDVKVNEKMYPTPRLTRKGLQKIYGKFMKEKQAEIPLKEVG